LRIYYDYLDRGMKQPRQDREQEVCALTNSEDFGRICLKGNIQATETDYYMCYQMALVVESG
jgi:hypothetical protein